MSTLPIDEELDRLREKNAEDTELFDKYKRIIERHSESLAMFDKYNKNCKFRERIDEVIHQTYGIGDISLLENALQELCSSLDINIPKKELKFVKLSGWSFRYEDEDLEKNSQLITHIKDAVDQFYEGGYVSLLQKALEDICALVQVDLPKNRPNLLRKKDN